MSEVEIKVWMRGLVASLTASQAGVDVLGEGPGQAGDLGPPDFPGHGLHRLEIPRGGEGKPGLDDIHVEEFQVPGDLQFFVHVQVGPRGLFPVSQGRVEDIYFFRHDWSSSKQGQIYQDRD